MKTDCLGSVVQLLDRLQSLVESIFDIFQDGRRKQKVVLLCRFRAVFAVSRLIKAARDPSRLFQPFSKMQTGSRWIRLPVPPQGGHLDTPSGTSHRPVTKVFKHCVLFNRFQHFFSTVNNKLSLKNQPFYETMSGHFRRNTTSLISRVSRSSPSLRFMYTPLRTLSSSTP